MANKTASKANLGNKAASNNGAVISAAATVKKATMGTNGPIQGV